MYGIKCVKQSRKFHFCVVPFALDLTNPLKQYYDEGSKYSNTSWVYFTGRYV